MAWYKATFSVHDTDFYQHGKIEGQFEKIFMTIHNRQDMALFSSGFSASDTYSYYFAPACDNHPAMKAFMESLKAVPCEEPTRETEDELGLVCGEAGKWNDHVWAPDSP